jgi:hypothetical protein
LGTTNAGLNRLPLTPDPSNASPQGTIHGLDEQMARMILQSINPQGGYWVLIQDLSPGPTPPNRA